MRYVKDDSNIVMIKKGGQIYAYECKKCHAFFTSDSHPTCRCMKAAIPAKPR